MRKHGRRARWIAGAGIGTAAAIGGAGTAQAADFTVTSLADDGSDGTLRQEIADALAAGAGNRIVFQSGLSGSITLASGQISLSDGIEIAGPGADQVTIDANDLSRHFYIPTGLANKPVKISGLTLIDGNTLPQPQPRSGGSILARSGNLTISGTTISSSTTSINGGAITLSGSTANGYSKNTVIESSTISGNSAAAGGGAIYSRQGAGTIRNTTITGNTTTGSFGFGGAISDGVSSYAPTPTTIINSTITGNTGTTGGGIYHYGYVADDVLKNTIVSGNSADTSPDLGGSFGAQFSLIGDDSDATINETVAGSNLIGVDPLLGPLQNNGGPTPTMAPDSASPIVDQGISSGAATDQRGEARPFDVPTVPNSTAAGADGADIGAVELAAGDLPQPPTVSFTTDPPTGLAGQAVQFTATAADPDGTVESIGWDFDDDGDFDDGSGASVSHTFAAAGSYPVTVQVTDDDGQTATSEQTITVVAAPIAGFTFEPAAPLTGQTITFTSTSSDLDGTIESTEWDLDNDGAFDDGSGDTASTSFATAGPHIVGIQVTDDDGLIAEAQQTVTVNAPTGAPPPPPGSLPQPLPVPDKPSAKEKCKKKKSKKARQKCLKKLKKKKRRG